MGTAIDFFVADPSFYNHSTPFISVLDKGGIGRLTQHSLSYFVDLYIAKDTRAATARTVDWSASYSPSFLIDENFYSTFITQFEAATTTVQQALFQIVDRLIFHPGATDDTETWLTTTAGVKDLYVANSFSKPTTNVTSPVYTDNSGTTQQFTTTPYVLFSINLPSGTTTIQYDLTVFCDDATWDSKYPNSDIVAVSPPIPYSELLTSPLSTANGNVLATATSTVDLNYDSISAQIEAAAASGYYLFKVAVVDSANNTSVSAPFLILYKGAIPTQLELRVAVKDAVLASGVGTQAQWEARIPDLFVDTQFYLIPQYDNITTLSDSTVYPSIMNTYKVYQNVGKVLTSVDSSFLQQNTELLVANYEKLLIAGVADTSTETAGTTTPTLLALFPTYQMWSSTDTNFQYMATDAQQFSLNLTDALVVATGNGTSSTLYAVTDRNLEYVSFVINSVEYCVITKTCYTELLEATT